MARTRLAIVFIVGLFYVYPHVLIPAIVRWQTRRRGGIPPEPAGRGAKVLMAGMLVGFIILMSWDSSLGRPSLIVLCLMTVGLLFGLWRSSRREEGDSGDP